MTLVSVIECDRSLTLEGWEQLIDDHESLAVPRGSDDVNPLTGAPTSAGPTPGLCHVIIDGDHAGAIEPSSEFEEDRRLLVYASDPDEHWVEELVDAVAEVVGGSVESSRQG